MKQHTNRISYTGQDGFSLLEVLVALLIFSIGLLGLAALQTTGLKFNQQSYQRTQAVIQAYDILDRIRANPVEKISYSTIAQGEIPADPACTTCSTTQMRDLDVRQWNQANAALLSEGTGMVAINASSSIATVTIEWKENDLRMRLVVEAQPW